jgi:hypothetical protein
VPRYCQRVFGDRDANTARTPSASPSFPWSYCWSANENETAGLSERQDIPADEPRKLTVTPADRDGLPGK